MKTILVATALLAATPATASTLILYDVDASYGERLAITPLLEQEFARNTRSGLASPILVPVNDDGSPRTVEVDVAAPVPVYPLGPGVRVQRGRVTWRITTSLSGNALSYEAVIVRASAMTDGVTLTAPTVNQTNIVGTARVDGPGPAIARRYAAPGGSRMVFGFLRP